MTNWDPEGLPPNTDWRKIYQRVWGEWVDESKAQNRSTLQKRDLALRLLDDAAWSLSMHGLGRPPSFEETRLAMMTALSGMLMYLKCEGSRDFFQDDEARRRLWPLESLFTALLDVHENQCTVEWLAPRVGHHPRYSTDQRTFRTSCARAYKLLRRSRLGAAAAEEKIILVADFMAARLGIKFRKNTIRNWVSAHNRRKDPEFVAEEEQLKKQIDSDIQLQVAFYKRYPPKDRCSVSAREIEATVCRKHAERFLIPLMFEEPFLLPQPYDPPVECYFEKLSASR